MGTGGFLSLCGMTGTGKRRDGDGARLRNGREKSPVWAFGPLTGSFWLENSSIVLLPGLLKALTSFCKYLVLRVSAKRK